MSTEKPPASTAALTIAFLVTPMVWVLVIAFLIAVDKELAGPEQKGDSALAVFSLLALGAGVATTMWVAGLVTYAITGKGLGK